MRHLYTSIPIRTRLALAFAGLMAIVLGGVGLLVYLRTEAGLDAQIDRELAARTAGVVAIVRDDGDDLGDPVHDPLSRVDPEGAVQVLAPGPRIADATPAALRDHRLLSTEEVDRLLHGPAESIDVATPAGRLRVVAERTQDDGVRYVVISGAWLEERDQALSTLAGLLLIGGPVALGLASIAAFWVATAALRPVEAMRRDAARISAGTAGGRLSTGPASDEIAALGTTLNEMLERLAAAFEHERRFAADASHELRTPLAILKAETDLALEDGADPAELREALRSVAAETDRLSLLAEDLLVLARADQGRLPVRIESVRLSELVARVLRERSVLEPARELDANVPDDLVVAADPLRLAQALGNLVDNALRYGGGTVTVSAVVDDGGVAISVSDEGAGFPADLLPKAKRRFARSGDGGTGLGLAIVDSIAIAHGGSLTLANDGGGAVATLELPRTPSPARS